MWSKSFDEKPHRRLVTDAGKQRDSNLYNVYSCMSCQAILEVDWRIFLEHYFRLLGAQPVVMNDRFCSDTAAKASNAFQLAGKTTKLFLSLGGSALSVSSNTWFLGPPNSAP